MNFALRLAIAPVVASLLAACATGGGAPIGRYDFRYSAGGDSTIRPYQVFDDGRATYLQFSEPPSPDLRISVAAASSRIDQPIERRGGLLVIPSVANALVVSTNGVTAQVRYQGPDRRTQIAVASGVDAAPPASNVISTPVPIADVPVTSTSTPAAKPEAAASVSAAAPAAPKTTSAQPPDPASIDSLILAVGGNTSTPSRDGSALARVFRADAIRSSGSGRDEQIQIRFAAARPVNLAFTTPDGAPLRAQWSADGLVVTLDAVPVFLVSDSVTTVQVRREAPDYRFDPTNAAHLTGVFDQDGATYFKFAGPVSHLTIVDAAGRSNGTQKGAYYKFNGVSRRFTITADGISVEVTREGTGRFTDQVTS
ncbi:TrbG/VirB9 family P-type conjugative transfer protein (plasmid) [Burkholderia cenocepacia]|uniref:TrbG/VirB9 family P-type conjugative transfer protein n=1 Tax=Burkholderia cenocepacia TaxID=95486 RepID=UPI0020A190A5|nr:TrbG/VirB9 family P-type conjugative transfer protein [Burkholderia cenocepacia]MCO8402816.1 TrbG/VirB9 family P-type conjugative transfer protein [Burkholderia cenocepacia]MCO8415055.1 TrbG/VirB9 family P-type conjugative transfer protein [Burkholderia cenocepacia]MCO8423049.1 TrbG/VirB9 family P-type conjugative transfer protein [Burkholderia cenocepacia]MCO8474802.1 TrbG/VirB9 family P-type conjugative transfer protein [Burkholderia cenocepacia]MCO8482018.1 TrbG/VirB9 family P-type conju